ncbi:MAG TPA: gliding motility-associated C-terminal domain-containing protein [Fluviicola sp.]|nr:gliding motility-associated C-terminal domain-containing protein [Fluviicola sp.]
MSKPVLYIVFLLGSLLSFAQQNLVPNGGFEDYTSCPLGIADYTAAAWVLPTWGTSDYFNSCNLADAGIPSNFAGHQQAHSGFGYSGFGSCFEIPNQNSREYLQVELMFPLETGKEYAFSCFVSLAEVSKFCMKDVGIAVTNNPIGGSYVDPIPFLPYLESVSPDYICDTINWVRLDIRFIANGGEKFLTIGQFKNDADADIFVRDSLMGGCAYYYIDDVSLMEYQSPEIPNVFSPNGDNLNDLWALDLPNGHEVKIFNRWGEMVNNGKTDHHAYSWDGKGESGADCAEGVYFYTIEKNDFKKTGFIHLIR